MSKWFSKDNIKSLYCPDTPVNVVLSVKYSDNIPSTEKHFAQRPLIKDPKQYKIYDTYDKVKSFSKKKKSELKWLEIMKYFEIETEDDNENNSILQINCKNTIKNADKIIIDKTGPQKPVDKKYDIIVAQGSLKNEDTTVDESYVFNLLLQETIYALNHQQQDGMFILKIFDCVTKPTIQLLYLLTNMYSYVDIIKPRNSRDYSSERFVVCRGYRNNMECKFEGSSKKTYIKDIFYGSKVSYNDSGSFIDDILCSNDLLYKRNSLVLKKIEISIKQITLANEFINAFFDNKYVLCSHKIQDRASDMILCAYCDSVIIL